ncbi:GTP-binding protein [Butyrivibrio sp. TB]|uniref:GTP-binding protein n=1 Tax=Butyrivibrio sp. TB TaxID=1520809 RepID=UPI0008BB1736|nr:GTP-binding protein [Butyrivibrio sp. TB]SEP54763.1 Cobalamin synthesis protein cobW C-terminal domain-containing protein [Butyrivibrio sp. TB]
MTKVDIISGFLGAGKTTLIKKLLAEALSGTKTVLIENEFGEVGVDGGFLQQTGIEIREMNAGCICCSLVGDFDTNLTEIMNKYSPERILIEPSGVGKLSDVAEAIKNVTEKFPDMILNSAVTVVDVTKAKVYIKNFGEFFTNQIESAGTIILTRTDKADDAKIEEVVELIRTLNKKATIITTPLSELDGKEILDTFEGNHDLEKELLEEMMRQHDDDDDEDEHEHHHHHHDDDDDEDEHEHHHHHHDDDDEDEHEHHHHHHDDDDDEDEHEHHHHHHDDDDEDEHEHHHHHHEAEADEEGVVVHHSDAHHHHHHHHHHGGHDADEVFQSWALETPVKYSKADIETMLDKLSDDEKYGVVLRSKGMVEDADGKWIEFDYVPDETQIREGHADVTGKIVVIGSGLKEDALEDLFRRRG